MNVMENGWGMKWCYHGLFVGRYFDHLESHGHGVDRLDTVQGRGYTCRNTSDMIT